MRKGLVSFIIILCMLVPLAVGCQNNTAGSTIPTLADPLLQATESATNAAQPELTEPDTTGSEVTEPQEAESSTPSASLDPTQSPATEPVNQETEPPTTTPPQTEPPKETTPPVTEEPEITEPTTPTEPKPTEPKPTQPPVTEPPETEPPAIEPAEVIELDALVQYGLQYAADTYGYRIYPGTRAGYYPAYTCVFSTMAEGKADIRGCVDDTTRALLAVPGFQIVAEIDGVICRARIDIVIVKQGDNNYLVNVYYG